jgi:hypothetical protein
MAMPWKSAAADIGGIAPLYNAACLMKGLRWEHGLAMGRWVYHRVRGIAAEKHLTSRDCRASLQSLHRHF